MTTATSDWRDRATITVEEAAEILGIGRSAAYAAAREGGGLPTIRIGHRRLLVPVAKLRALLGETENSATAGNRDAVQDLTGGGGDGHVESYMQP